MCFSAKASFGAAAVLGTIGMVTLVKAKTKEERILATMPLLFCLQQISEGFLWLSLMYPAFQDFKQPSFYTFLFFAEMVWPIFVPLMSLMAEPELKRRNWMKALLGIGFGIDATLIAGFLLYPSFASLKGRHIFYDVQFPLVNYWFYGLIYFLPTILAPLLSSYKRFRVFGVSLFLAYVGSRIFYNHYVISIWCYFGALLSIYSLMMIQEMQQLKAKRMEIEEC